MARFRGTTQGDRGQASRLGHRELTSTADGWNIGCDVALLPQEDGTDKLIIRITGGSNNSSSWGHIEARRVAADKFCIEADPEFFRQLDRDSLLLGIKKLRDQDDITELAQLLINDGVWEKTLRTLLWTNGKHMESDDG